MIGFAWPLETSGVDDVTVVTPLFRYANYAEAVLWVAIGAYLIVRARRKGSVKPNHVLLAITFVAFGASDVMEASIGSGAWWRPWWLLVWKGACLLVFLVVFLSVRMTHGSQNRGLGASPKS